MCKKLLSVFVLVLCFTGMSFGSLVGYWSFDEGTGTNVHDSVVADHNGVLVQQVSGGPAGFWTADHNGVPNKAYNFNGTTGLVLKPTTLATSGISKTFSIAFWANGNANIADANARVFVARNTDDPNLLKSRIEVDLLGEPNAYTGWSNTYFVAGPNTIPRRPFLLKPAIYKGSWHHFVYTRNAYDGTLSIWVDGMLKARSGVDPCNLKPSQETYTLPLNLADFDNIKIGAGINIANGQDNCYRGAIDEFKIFNHELSRDEIRSMAGYQTPTLAKPHLYGWWKFDDAAGHIATDSSGYGNDGVFCFGYYARQTGAWTTGVKGGAYQFNGDSLEVPLAPIDQLSDAVTVSFWAKPDTLKFMLPFQASGHFAQEKESFLDVFYPNMSGYADANDVILRWCLTFESGKGHHDQHYYAMTSDYPNSRSDANVMMWHNFVCTKDRKQGLIRIFLDGKLVAGVTGMTLPLNSNDFHQFDIGSGVWGSSGFVGSIDDFQIYDIAHLDENAVGRILGTTDCNMAFNADPYDGKTAVPQATSVLSWVPGDNAVSHRVYFGTDPAVVASATSGYTVRTDPNFIIPSPLAFNTNYYWRVDEVSASGHVAVGKMWYFVVEVPIYTVDTFETYTATTKRVRDYWKRTTGAYTSTDAVSLNYPDLGYLYDANAVHDGSQSMKLKFNNNSSPYKTEIDANVIRLPYASRDFAKAGVKAMDIWIRGVTSNVKHRVYLRLVDMSNVGGTVACPDPNVLVAADVNDWNVWRVSLAEPNFAPVNKSNIQYIRLGIGNGTNAGQPGTYGYGFIDGIRLYGPRCLGAYDSDADISGYAGQPDCKVDLFDLRLFAEQWLSASAVDNGPDADFDGVNGVNLIDFSTLANDWLKVYPMWP
jgi:hypothetical protein